jgi:phosphoribosylformimino-5-aminoimidazole carboxamide ribotide isomerase
MSLSSPVRKRMEVIPAIDLLDGGIVRLFQGDFGQVTEYANDPVSLARQYAAAGAKRLHVVDLDGAKTGQPTNLPIIAALAECGMEIQAGGGIRDQERVSGLLSSGVTRAVIGSVAVKQRERVAEWIEEVGADRFILAFDVRLNDNNEPETATDGWARTSGTLLWPLVEYFLARGAKEFLCTDIEKDGTLAGPNIGLYQTCANRYPEAEFIASGGVSCVADLDALDQIGIARVVTGKALLDGRLTLKEIETFSRGA